MILRPIIASYSGKSYERMKNALTDDYLEVISNFINDPDSIIKIDDKIIDDLLEMHILKYENQDLLLNTAVFLEEDIKMIMSLAKLMGNELATILMDLGSPLDKISPEIKNFLGGVVGVSQGASKFLRESNLMLNWKAYEGRYASCKVDFNEDCDLLNEIGADLQIKTTLRGNNYTAVFIGPSGINYQNMLTKNLTQDNLTYIKSLLIYLTDAYPLLLEGKIASTALTETAKEVNLYRGDEPKKLVVTPEITVRYFPIVKKIINRTSRYYKNNINRIRQCLENTTSGKLGVPVENMMMHFWRYCRKVFANELYESGFYTDDIKDLGNITIFYDHRIKEINELF